MTLRPEGTAPVIRSFIDTSCTPSTRSASSTTSPDVPPRAPAERALPSVSPDRRGGHRSTTRRSMPSSGNAQPFLRSGGIDDVTLQINSLGCPECRPAYRQALLAFLDARLGKLCADCQRRAVNNPLRALDCKVPGCQEATAEPRRSSTTFALAAPDISLQCAATLMTRGALHSQSAHGARLDYYTKTTFEMVTTDFGAQSAWLPAGAMTDCRRSRRPPLPGIGFAMALSAWRAARHAQ